MGRGEASGVAVRDLRDRVGNAQERDHKYQSDDHVSSHLGASLPTNGVAGLRESALHVPIAISHIRLIAG
jgi:hypothetical protein